MRIIQISDIHIPHKGEAKHEFSIRINFERILANIKKIDFDALVITGDLAYKSGDETIYSYIKEQLDAIKKQVFIIPGNHDDKHLLKSVLFDYFPTARYFYEQKIAGKEFLFLNTGIGEIDSVQISWLQQKLESRKDCVVFMHYPPINSGVVYMDANHALQKQNEILDVLYSHPYTVHVFCGHYHVAKQIITKNVYINICPSTYYQIHETSKRFAIGSRDIGYRIITLEDGKTSSEVVWLKSEESTQK